MSEENAQKALKICLFSLDREIGESFIQTVCKLPAPVDRGSTECGDRTVMLELFSGELDGQPDWKSGLADSGAAIMLVQFMDVISIESIKKNLARIKAEKTVPMVYCLFREDGQTDYKISCPECGQKLWIRDQDAGKKGRCPNCKNHFMLPSQTEGLRSKLGLHEGDDVLRFVRKDAQMGLNALSKVMAQSGAPAEVKKMQPRPSTKKVIFIKR